MAEGMIRTCPSCGKKNRIQYSRLNEQARCGSCGTALPPLPSAQRLVSLPAMPRRTLPQRVSF